MKLKITLFIPLFLYFNFSSAQEYCGTSNNYPNKKFSSLSRMLNGDPANEEMLCLKIFFHIVTNDDGSNGINSNDTSIIIDDLNARYASYNISFHNAGHDTINNTLLNDIQESEKDDLVALNNKPDAINFYIVKSAVFYGWANGIPGKDLIITAESAFTGIAAHEVGHCLNLWHTHETDKFGVEIQDDCSSYDESLCNCTTAGDLLCDTPPDPNLRISEDNYKVDTSCNYLFNDGYNPDTKNIMSYTRPSCLQHFTNGQAIRMRDAILNEPILEPVLNCDCSNPFYIGKSTICSTETVTYSIPCSTGSFIISSNLQTISSTNNSITVKPINSAVNGKAFVKTTIDNTLYQKDIWVGKPKGNIQLTPELNFVFMELIGVSSNIHEQDITDIKWETLSASGGGIMGQLIDRFENLARGIGTSWSIEAKITLTNDCGTSYIYRTIAPPEPPPCEGNYKIAKTDKNEYITYRIIDPCARTAYNENNTEKVKDKDIIEAALFNIYGFKVKSYDKNLFDTRYLKNGVYIFKVQVKDELFIQKIIVE